jgi:hypothetical protein
LFYWKYHLKEIVIGEWLLVNGEAVPFGQILNAFGEATTHHSPFYQSILVLLEVPLKRNCDW